jgi:DmsE family decaheme c-type cytochrome
MRRARVSRVLIPCSLALCMMVCLLLRSGRAAGGEPPQQAAGGKAGSINNEDCAVCHEEVVKAFDRNAHAVLEKGKDFQKKNSCESCHGPGEAHATNDGDKTKIIGFGGAGQARKYNEQCLSCHQNNAPMEGFRGALHGKSGLACVDCHGVHKSERLTHMLKKPETVLCMECHVETRTAFSKPYHHRVKEGAVRCTDCHEVHSGLERHQMRVSLSGDEACNRCHPQTKGPFVYEHAPLQIRSCQACHEPHGSNNPKMLIRPTVWTLCLECHSATKNVLGSQPPSFHNVNSPRFQNCTVCHVKIHGSNASSLFTR